MLGKSGPVLKLIGQPQLPLPTPLAPLCQKRRVPLAAGKNDAELEPVLFNQIPKALAEELARVVQARAILDLAMGAGAWATVALEQGLPHFGAALTDMRYHEVMYHLKGGGRSCRNGQVLRG